MELSAIPEAELPAPSGYQTHDEYFAVRFKQGERVVYAIDLSVPQLVATLPEPNPDRKEPGNRKINLAHARGFAEYVRERPSWVCPSLLLRAPEGEFEFRAIPDVAAGGSDLGVLAVPKLARQSIYILDGQHRILGFHLAWRQITESIQTAREDLAIARRNGPNENIKEAERRLAKHLEIRERMSAERVSLNIVIVDDPEAYKQVFVDIADNAKGVTRTLSSRFDSRKVVNRALPLVMEHPLLQGRIEEESDRISSVNSNFLTAKHLADIIRTVQVGVSSRITKRLEDELVDRNVAERANGFFDALVAAFPDLKEIEEGELSPMELRQESLLGSATMIRVLAGVYHDLHTGQSDPSKRKTQDEIIAFFKTLAPHMQAPVPESGGWREHGVWMDSGMAPQASQGDVRKLTTDITAWIDEPPAWIAAS